MGRILALAFNAIVLALASSPSFSETYPSRSITLVVPFAAGTVTDTVARFLADGLNKSMNVPVIVENRAGANGVVGARSFVNDTKADGYTVFVSTNSANAAAVSLFKSLGYDPVKDFSSISRVMQTPLVLVVRPDLPAKSLQALLSLAKSKELAYGSGNSSSQVASELIAHVAKTKFNRIPYTGNNRAIMDVMANRVDFMIADLGTALPQIEAGKVRALAVTSKARIKQLPDVPTVTEAGIPDYEFIGWIASFVKAGTPPEIISKLNAAIVKTLNSPEADRFFYNLGGQAFPSTPEELDMYVKSEIEKWKVWVDLAGIEKQ